MVTLVGRQQIDVQLLRAQACSFRDSYEDFCKVGATVVGVSKGDAASHQTFRKKHNLPFMLLCDEEDKVSRNEKCPFTFEHPLMYGAVSLHMLENPAIFHAGHGVCAARTAAVPSF